ncbi:uroporphyrinogen decarboxylase [Desulfolithobacter dissulfuricans]|uniref:Uroporphyrinogen decarboxylase n=2 Tax=Desulfolithobacter dissulfuricans TaxID=2795293 RepID=A0A915TZA6_9BACT|nr:uroporphyrinogen decarboxylase [Desulfolithobacter dissulfuricans]BCO07995.1 uroporphyrinogen decarboxylase [Desulfolithobacter dissulfuricans]
MMNDTFLRACRGEKTDYTPVWFMRQAGRYLPEYQKIRKKGTFLDLCKTPELAAEVTLQPIDIFGMDAAILFSDILIPMEAMNLTLEFHEGRGPVFPDPVRDQQAVDNLIVPDPDETMPFVMETIRILRRELKVPLIGFSGAPFTLATYLIEGGSSKVFLETKRMMFQAPELYDALLTKITRCTSLYLQAQARAGAQALQIFDSWAGVLAPCDYERFALPYVQSIIRDLRQTTDVPIIYFANNGSTLLGHTTTAGADVLGLDWRINIGDAIRKVGDHAVQGNLDPIALFLPRDELRQRVHRLLDDARDARGHIFNLGHGILPQTPPEQAKIAVDAVHEYSGKKA